MDGWNVSQCQSEGIENSTFYLRQEIKDYNLWPSQRFTLVCLRLVFIFPLDKPSIRDAFYFMCFKQIQFITYSDFWYSCWTGTRVKHVGCMTAWTSNTEYCILDLVLVLTTLAVSVTQCVHGPVPTVLSCFSQANIAGYRAMVEAGSLVRSQLVNTRRRNPAIGIFVLTCNMRWQLRFFQVLVRSDSKPSVFIHFWAKPYYC